MKPLNNWTQVRDESALPAWAREPLLEWYFGDTRPRHIQVLYTYGDEQTVVALVRGGESADPLDIHRVFRIGGAVHHSVDAQFEVS